MNFIIVFSLFVTLIFPIILSLFGLDWVGSDESPLYRIIVIGCNGLILLYVAYYELIHHKKAQGSSLPYLIPLVVAVLYFLENAFASVPLGEDSQKALQFFFAFSCGGIAAATYCYRYNKLPLIIKNLELLMLICSIALIAALPNLIASSDSVARIGGGNHQSISYSAALSFGVIYCSLVRNTNLERYRIFKWKFYPLIAIAILILLAVICLIGGGRGGAILMIINFLLCTYIIAKKNFSKIILGLIAATGILYILSSFSSNGLEIILERGFERCFAFIDSKGKIDMENGSSGRDEVYNIAFRLIEQKPVFGHGIFKQYELCQKYINQPYSHNIFLEILLQWGLCGIILFVTLLFLFLPRLYRLISKRGYFIYLLPLATYPLLMLQLSGTYLFNPSFWFIVIITFGYSKKILSSTKQNIKYRDLIHHNYHKNSLKTLSQENE